MKLLQIDLKLFLTANGQLKPMSQVKLEWLFTTKVEQARGTRQLYLTKFHSTNQTEHMDHMLQIKLRNLLAIKIGLSPCQR